MAMRVPPSSDTLSQAMSAMFGTGAVRPGSSNDRPLSAIDPIARARGQQDRARNDRLPVELPPREAMNFDAPRGTYLNLVV